MPDTPPTDPFAPRPDTGWRGFTCPDGEPVTFDACLAKCRMASRCAPRPILAALASGRRTDATPSTTEILGPPRLAWLKRMYPWHETPASRKWALMGSAMSVVLEDGASDNELAEATFRDATNKGTLDHYDPETKTLTDWKFWGAFPVSMIVTCEREVPGEVFKSGPRKGKQKLARVLDLAGAGARLMAEKPETAWQLNDYAAKVRAYGFPVEHLTLFLVVRDADMWAKQRGLSEPWYAVDVPLKPESEVRAYMKQRRAELEGYLDTGICPPICTPIERWNERRCDSFCPLRKRCDEHDGANLRAATAQPETEEKEEI